MQSAKKPLPITKIIMLTTYIHMLKSTGKLTSTLKHVYTYVWLTYTQPIKIHDLQTLWEIYIHMSVLQLQN